MNSSQSNETKQNEVAETQAPELSQQDYSILIQLVRNNRWNADEWEGAIAGLLSRLITIQQFKGNNGNQ